jgi:pimeloyl-ACP methyl ester carboxylesterase
MNTSPTVTVLIHGGQVGAWVWGAVRSQLTAPSIAVDLPAHGNRGGALKGLGVGDCVDTVVSELPPTGRVVLVGHSFGAAIALTVAHRVADRIAHIVLIAGMVPNPGAPLLSSFPPATRLISNVLFRLTPEFSQPLNVIKTKLLNGMSGAQADEAASKFTKESSSLFLDRVDWHSDPAIPVTYVLCLNDRGALSPAFQKQLAGRLGSKVTIASIDACHYAMLEKPTEVAAVINAIAP